MQKQVFKKWSWKTLLPTAAVTGVMLLTPLLGVVDTADAKSHGHGRSFSRHGKSNGNNGVRRRTRTRRGWDRNDNGVRRRTRRGWDRNDRWERNDRWDRSDDNGRRFRWRYRTRYDRFGNPYRQWFKQYF